MKNKRRINVLRMRYLSRKRRVTNESATPVTKTLARRSEYYPCQGNRLSGAQKETRIEEMKSGCSEDDSCRRNKTWALRMHALSRKRHVGAENVAHCG